MATKMTGSGSMLLRPSSLWLDDVDQLLKENGLPRLDRASLRRMDGRNESWAAVTERGVAIFVKRLNGADAEKRHRIQRALAFEDLRSVLKVPAPELLASQSRSFTLVHEYIADSRSGAELMVDEEFSDELAYKAGGIIGHLHNSKLSSSDRIDRSSPHHPPVEYLEGLPLAVFENSTAAALEAWKLMQSDQHLLNAIKRLREWELLSPRSPCHCDLRMDQFLVTGRSILLADWEEFRLADPARDVGSFIGQWISRAIMDIITNRGGDTAFIGLEMTHDIVLQRGLERLGRLLPRAHSFWKGYLNARPDADKELGVRATAFAGWHLFDRLLAAGEQSSRLASIQRAAAGVGRTALLRPERFAKALGLEPAS
ncbi:hypothetical protein DP939_45010 [Spongiactinospora rosea]|uniref:Aminoglycoside phosphotransferase domain-containing protein n=1 Tax=Spongiactinospora rosea TaxID=2248750 RepID=A0A366LDP8_9ACTN|nr:class V lanthionine synthetase subunit LxmK [Spongiactinospora rosea]RBQ11629.1 hypothetical protein DP939_45010 [Spongiactinospora rosea]